MLSAIFEQVTKSVTRAVLYAGVIPLLATLLVNATLAALLVGAGSWGLLSTALNQPATTMAGTVTLLAILLVVCGIALAAFAPTFRTALQRGGPLASVLAAISDAETRDEPSVRSQLDSALNEVGHQIEFRDSHLKSLRETRARAPVMAPPPEDVTATLLHDVESALADPGGEDGVERAESRLAAHFRQYGAARTQLASRAILSRLDALLADAKSDVASLSRKGFDSPNLTAATHYGRRFEYIGQYVAATYNIDSIVFWTRLQSVIPEGFGAKIENAKQDLDLLTATTVLMACSVAAWLVLVPIAFPSWPLLWSVAIVGGFIVYVLYAAATAAALTFAELVCAAFDLFRRDLLTAMGIQPPESLREERDLWLNLSRLILYEQIPDDIKLSPARPLGSSVFGPSRPGGGPSVGPSTGIVVPRAGG